MLRSLSLMALMLAGPLYGGEEDDFDPAGISEVDAINCYLDAPTYNGFALAVGGEEDLAARRHWRKIENENPFLAEYELPAPITVTGSYTTRRIAFTSTGILAILDLADPAIIARDEDIINSMDAEPLIKEIVASGKATRAQVEAEMTFRKFLGERVIADVTEPPADGESFGMHTVIARTISNFTTHPGKTLYGCSYRIELLGKDGKPL